MTTTTDPTLVVEPNDGEEDRAMALVLAKWPGSGRSSIEVRACAIGLAANRAELERLNATVRLRDAELERLEKEQAHAETVDVASMQRVKRALPDEVGISCPQEGIFIMAETLDELRETLRAVCEHPLSLGAHAKGRVLLGLSKNEDV